MRVNEKIQSQYAGWLGMCPVYMVFHKWGFSKDYYFIPTKWWLWYWFVLNVFIIGKPYETFSGKNMAPIWGGRHLKKPVVVDIKFGSERELWKRILQLR